MHELKEELRKKEVALNLLIFTEIARLPIATHQGNGFIHYMMC